MMLHVHTEQMLSPLQTQLTTSLGRKKTESNCLANFPRTIYQTSSLFRQSQHKRKIRDKTRGIVHNCSDLTCTKKYALTEGPKRGGGGGINVGHSLNPPSHLLRATGLFAQPRLKHCQILQRETPISCLPFMKMVLFVVDSM